MKTKLAHRSLILAATTLLLALVAAPKNWGAAINTAFTYQVRLTDSSLPVSGAYDLTFQLFDAASGGNPVSAALTNSAVLVTNGLATRLLDFGAAPFDGSDRWLQIGVRTNGSGGAFALFTPRQLLTPTPYAITAGGLSGTPTFNPASGPPFTVGNSNKVVNLNGDLLDGLDSSAFWKLGGNGGTTPGTNFIGTTDNQALELKVNNVPALRIEPNASSPNMIGGYAGVNGNHALAGVVGATISGGGYNGSANVVGANLATVGGGFRNDAIASIATIAGGAYQTASGAGAAIVGGISNLASATYSFVGGGERNQASAEKAVVGGGILNRAMAGTATVAGGSNNSATETDATVGGGFANAASGYRSFIGGGSQNTNSGHYATLGGGQSNKATEDSASVGGGDHNSATATRATVAGGNGNTASGGHSAIGGGFTNTANANYATIAGGQWNIASDDSAFVGGGDHNSAKATRATVGGGNNNTAGGQFVFIGGGQNNSTQTNPYSTIAGGFANQIFKGVNSPSADYATIAGGRENLVTSWHATVGGGHLNQASGADSVVAGGYANTASNAFSAIGGGTSNSAMGLWSTIPGGDHNSTLGNYSLAAGRGAQANHAGAFIWADSSAFFFSSSSTNEFAIRATGGARFVSAIDGNGNPLAGVQLPAGGGAWSPLSDRNSKTNFADVNGREILKRLAAVPVQTWNYRSQDATIRHIGPVAQDFAAAFGVGEDARHISTVDADGVALAAIQGLNKIVQEQDSEIAALKKFVAELQTAMQALAARQAAGGR